MDVRGFWLSWSKRQPHLRSLLELRELRQRRTRASGGWGSGGHGGVRVSCTNRVLLGALNTERQHGRPTLC